MTKTANLDFSFATETKWRKCLIDYANLIQHTGFSDAEISERTTNHAGKAVAAATVASHRNKRVRRPQINTVFQILKAIGYLKVTITLEGQAARTKAA